MKLDDGQTMVVTTGGFQMTDDNSERENRHPLALYAMAAHAGGDFPLQTDSMASNKFDDPIIRAKHVSVYTSAFLPVTAVAGWDMRQTAVFVAGIWGTHFVIDSRRWNENVPIWYDQALHIIALAVVWCLTVVVGRE